MNKIALKIKQLEAIQRVIELFWIGDYFKTQLIPYFAALGIKKETVLNGEACFLFLKEEHGFEIDKAYYIEFYFNLDKEYRNEYKERIQLPKTQSALFSIITENYRSRIELSTELQNYINRLNGLKKGYRVNTSLFTLKSI